MMVGEAVREKQNIVAKGGDRKILCFVFYFSYILCITTERPDL